MIEIYLQDSLKSVFLAANEYLSSVPHNEPDYRKQGANDLDHRIDHKDDEIYVDDLFSESEEEEQESGF